MFKTKRNIPWWLTMSRMFLLPLLFWLMYGGHTWWFLAAYILIGSTDFFDGLIARRLNQTSAGGQQLDSIADIFFYISSAYFLYYLFPEVITNNSNLVIAFFTILFLSFAISLILFKRLLMLHTTILRLNGVLVYFLIIFSFFFDTTWFARGILILYFIGYAEELLIFFIYGAVDADTRSIFQLRK